MDPEVGCRFTGWHGSHHIHHTESHLVPCVCSCGYLSSYRDAITKHECTRHRVQWTLVVQVYKPNWLAVHNLIGVLLDIMPSLPTLFSFEETFSGPCPERGTQPGSGRPSSDKEPRAVGALRIPKASAMDHQVRERRTRRQLSSNRDSIQAIMKVW